MLRTNLASRPFYNDRAVRFIVLLVGFLALVFGLVNAVQILSLRERTRVANARIAEVEAKTAALRGQADQIRQSLNQDAVDAAQNAARQANQLIDQRAFSWTELFNRFEETLPANVRITAVQPQVDARGDLVIAITALSRTVEDIDAFIDALEKSGAFTSTLTRSEEIDEDGLFRSELQGYYRHPAEGPTPASDVTGPPATEPAPADGAKPPAAPGAPAAAEERR